MKRSVSLALFILAALCLDAQTQFQKVAGTTLNDRNYHLASMADGTLYATGYTESVPGVGREAFVVKYSPLGEVVWAKTYGGPGDETNWDIIVTQNNQLVGAGHSTGLGVYPVGVLTRADSTGAVLWAAGVGAATGTVNFYRVMETSDGHLVATGLTTMNGNEDILICKFTASGQLLWSRIVATPQDDEIMGMIETTTGHYLFAGLTSDSLGNGGTEFAVIKTDANGNVLWSKRYGGAGSDRLNAVVEHDNAYYFMGWTSQGVIGGNDVVVMRTDTGGVVQWVYAYGTPQAERSFNMVYDGNRDVLVVAGYTDYSHPGTNNRNTFLMQLDLDGDMLWARSYGSTGTDGHWPTGLAMTDDDGYYVLASTNTFGPGSYSLYLVKTDGDGHTACHQKDPLFIKDTITGWVGVPFGTNSTVTLTAMPAIVVGMPWALTDTTLCCTLHADGGPDVGVCDGSTVQIGHSDLPGYQYTWSYQGTMAGTGAFRQVASAEAGTWILAAAAPGTGCTSANDTVVVTLLPTPPPVTISYVTTPGNYLLSSATYGNQWFHDGNILAGETQQQIHASVNGKYHSVVTNAVGCQAISDTIDHVVIGIEEGQQKILFYLFPNPAGEKVTVTLTEAFNTARLEMHDMQGRQVYSETFSSSEPGSQHTLSTGHLPAGNYIVVVITENGRSTTPLVIRR